ncbi:unnamed protein product, partial [Owenia fusiformis]
DSQPWVNDISGSEGTVSDVNSTLVTGSFSISVSGSDQMNQMYCRPGTYIYVMVDSGKTVDEADDSNNFAWKQISLNCPGIQGFSLIAFDIFTSQHDNKITDGENVITFTTTVQNIGVTMPAGSSPNYKFQVYIADDNQMENGIELTVNSFDGDEPRDTEMLTAAINFFGNITCEFEMTNEQCVGKTYLCLKAVEDTGLTADWDQFDGDNFQCMDFQNS